MFSNKSRCTASAVTDASSGALISKIGEHSHLPNLDKIRAEELAKISVKRALENVSIPPRRIISEMSLVSGTDVEMICQPDATSMTKRIQSKRQKLANLPPTPETFADAITGIPEKFALTSDGKEFLVTRAMLTSP